MTVPANPDHRVVTVWSDIASPAAAYALHVLRSRARERGLPLLVDHRAYPLELIGRGPLSKNVVDGEVRAATARERGLDWCRWPGADATFPTSSLLAMEAVQSAKRPSAGGLPASDQLDAALRHAFLARGRNIGVYAEIVDAARTCDLLSLDVVLDGLAEGAGRAEVMAQWATAAGGAVAGTPHLFTAGGGAEHRASLCPAGAADDPLRDDDFWDDDFWDDDFWDDDWAGRLLDTLRTGAAGHPTAVPARPAWWNRPDGDPATGDPGTRGWRQSIPRVTRPGRASRRQGSGRGPSRPAPGR